VYLGSFYVTLSEVEGWFIKSICDDYVVFW
jgi:hypothetical protein